MAAIFGCRESARGWVPCSDIIKRGVGTDINQVMWLAWLLLRLVVVLMLLGSLRGRSRWYVRGTWWASTGVQWLEYIAELVLSRVVLCVVDRKGT